MDVLGRSVKRLMPAEELQLAMSELYETMFGIYDHRADPSNARPLALVAAHPKENTSLYSPLYRRIDEYMRLKLGESTKMGLMEFLSMPPDFVRYCIAHAQREAMAEGKHADKMLAQLGEKAP